MIAGTGCEIVESRHKRCGCQAIYVYLLVGGIAAARAYHGLLQLAQWAYIVPYLQIATTFSTNSFWHTAKITPKR